MSEGNHDRHGLLQFVKILFLIPIYTFIVIPYITVRWMYRYFRQQHRTKIQILEQREKEALEYRANYERYFAEYQRWHATQQSIVWQQHRQQDLLKNEQQLKQAEQRLESRKQDREDRREERLQYRLAVGGYEDPKEARRELLQYRQIVLPKLLESQYGLCAYFEHCGSFLTETDVHIDHIIPLIRGGTNEDDNLQALCPTCNLRKGGKLESELMWVQDIKINRPLAAR